MMCCRFQTSWFQRAVLAGPLQPDPAFSSPKKKIGPSPARKKKSGLLQPDLAIL
jgi:hypothetical protein